MFVGLLEFLENFLDGLADYGIAPQDAAEARVLAERLEELGRVTDTAVPETTEEEEQIEDKIEGEIVEALEQGKINEDQAMELEDEVEEAS